MHSREGERLLELARDSIRTGLREGRPLAPDPAAFPHELRARRASFVTLRLEGELRGCVGRLEPVRPLVVDVAEHAFGAAFRDPRFPPVAPHELTGLDLHISVLNPPEPLEVASEEELVARLRPGLDGLVLEEGPHRGTFLPAVWQNVRDAAEFVRELKRKAGLAPDHWSPALRVRRYTVESIP